MLKTIVLIHIFVETDIHIEFFDEKMYLKKSIIFRKIINVFTVNFLRTSRAIFMTWGIES